MSFRTLAALLLTTSLVACASNASDGSTTGGGGGKADDSSDAQLTFGEDWSEKLTGAMRGGGTVRIAYDLDRIRDCRGETNDSQVWGAGGYASFDGGEPVAFELSRLSNGAVVPVIPELEIPSSATTIELWFAVSNKWGCIAYDSNMNANYQFDITPAPSGAVLSFDVDGSESQSGALTAGSQVVVHYEPERLSACSASSAGYAKWSVTMHYKTDGGPTKSLLVSRADGSDLAAADPTLTVPNGSDLEVWFSATSVYGCNAYDSNSGGNYHFEIE